MCEFRPDLTSTPRSKATQLDQSVVRKFNKTSASSVQPDTPESAFIPSGDPSLSSSRKLRNPHSNGFKPISNLNLQTPTASVLPLRQDPLAPQLTISRKSVENNFLRSKDAKEYDTSQYREKMRNNKTGVYSSISSSHLQSSQSSAISVMGSTRFSLVVRNDQTDDDVQIVSPLSASRPTYGNGFRSIGASSYSSRSGNRPGGFANLGNTCYMYGRVNHRVVTLQLNHDMLCFQEFRLAGVTGSRRI